MPSSLTVCSRAALCQCMPYGMNASVRPPSGSVCSVGPAALCERPHWNGSNGNAETACLDHTSLIYMPVPKGRRRLAGCVEIYNFAWKNDRSTHTVHNTHVSALIVGDVWVCHMHKDMLQMWRTLYNRAERAIRLKNVLPSTLILPVSNKLPWQRESEEDCPCWACGFFLLERFPCSSRGLP